MLNQKTAIVTGGGRGIGRAIVLEFVRQGADVAVIFASNQTAADETVSEAKQLRPEAVVRCYRCDVADMAETKTTVGQILEDFTAVDILVNNAGISRDGLLMQITEQDFDQVVDINLKGAFNMIKQLYQPFLRQRKGRIINISSVAGIAGNAGQANYAAAKAGLIGLSKTVAKELASRGITCNAIAPGFIETDMTEVLSEKIKTAALAEIPLKRMGQAGEVAQLAAYLASDAAAYITGQVMRIDGGLFM